MDILIQNNNPYVHTFKSLGQKENLDNYSIELNMSISADQRRYNAPAMEQVAAIWLNGSDERRLTRSIMIHANSGRVTFIRAYHSCYDPLAYPIFYPDGETGWEDKKILLENSPVVHFPRKKRKYTKRKKQENAHDLTTNLHIADGDNEGGDGENGDGDDGGVIFLRIWCIFLCDTLYNHNIYMVMTEV